MARVSCRSGTLPAVDAWERAVGGSGGVEVPEDIQHRVLSLCLALPDVTVRIDESRTAARSTAYSFDVRARSFCLLVATLDAKGNASPLLVLRADPGEREALLAMGAPFFAPRAGRGRIGVRVTKESDWQEIGELVVDSFRVVAPKKLWPATE